MSHYSSGRTGGGGGSRTGTMTATATTTVTSGTTPASPLGLPVSPPTVPFSPPSPSAQLSTGVSSNASPFYSHPSSPVSRFTQTHSGALNSLSSLSSLSMSPIPSNMVGMGGVSLINPAGMTTAGGGMIARPLASRVFHSLHPTAVQASHAIGKTDAMKEKEAAAHTNNTTAAHTKALPLTSISTTRKHPPNPSASTTPTTSGIPQKFGTFPRSGVVPVRGGAVSGGVSPGVDATPKELRPASPHQMRRESPSTGTMTGNQQTRSPSPAHTSPSQLHPRPLNISSGITTPVGGRNKVVRTPPQSRGGSNKKKSALLGSLRHGHSSIGEIGGDDGLADLTGHMADMDLLSANGGEYDAGAGSNSGYNSDASGISIESHTSNFPIENVHDIMNVNSEDAELAEVTHDIPVAYRGGFPASPMQLRHGAIQPPPHKMIGGAGAQTPSGNTPSGTSTPIKTLLSGSVGRSGSRGNDSALHSPVPDTPSKIPSFPMSPIPPLDSSLTADALGGSVGADRENYYNPTMPSVTTPSTSGRVLTPHEFTTVPALNLPRTFAKNSMIPSSTIPPLQQLDPILAVRTLSEGTPSAFSSARSHSTASADDSGQDWSLGGGANSNTSSTSNLSEGITS